MSTPQDADDARAFLGQLQDALEGKSDMTAPTGQGPRDQDRDRDRDRDRERDTDRGGDIVGGSNAPTSTSRVTRQASNGSSNTGGRSIAPVLAALLAGLLLGGLATAAYLGSQDDEDTGDEFAGAIDASRYQAVILSNDKVYFGKLTSISDDFFELDSAFFLRETRDDADAEPVRALLPVNREIHAPENTMLIRKDEVVLVENLAEDSPILTEINRQKG